MAHPTQFGQKLYEFAPGTTVYDAAPMGNTSTYVISGKLAEPFSTYADKNLEEDKYIYSGDKFIKLEDKIAKGFYLKAKDATNYEKTSLPITTEKAKKAFSKIVDFFYEEEPSKKHLEEDENGNTIEVEDEPKKSINWFKVGMCSTSVTLMIIGAIIMLIKRHK